MTSVALSYVVRDDGAILTVWNRKYGGWCLPGGKVEDGETLACGQHRELFEETCLETSRKYFVYSAISAVNETALCHVFKVETYNEDALPVELNSGVAWMTREYLLEHGGKFSDWMRKMFAELDHRERDTHAQEGHDRA